MNYSCGGCNRFREELPHGYGHCVAERRNTTHEYNKGCSDWIPKDYLTVCDERSITKTCNG